MKFDVQIRGLVPLLMDRFSEEMLTDVKKVKGDRLLSKDERTKIAELTRYMQKGKLVQPSIHIEMALAAASTEIRLSGAGKRSYKEIIKSSVFAYPEMIPHKHQEWEVDARAVVNRTTGGRLMKYRARLEQWELNFTLEVLDDRADPEALHEILKIAGLRKGLGSFRPRFGRFEVTKFKQLKEKK